MTPCSFFFYVASNLSTWCRKYVKKKKRILATLFLSLSVVSEVSRETVQKVFFSSPWVSPCTSVLFKSSTKFRNNTSRTICQKKSNYLKVCVCGFTVTPLLWGSCIWFSLFFFYCFYKTITVIWKGCKKIYVI